MSASNSDTHTALDNEASKERDQGIEICCPVMEIRQYVTKPGRCDDLMTLFEEHFIEGQEACNMRIIGQFRKRNDPDLFVWMRGFVDMEVRQKALHDFYSSPIWREHAAAANDTMIDVSNVLLLKPVHASSGLHLNKSDRPTREAQDQAGGIIIATVYSFEAPVDAKFVDFFTNDMAPVLRDAGATLLGQFVTEASENTFPQLPVREGENVFVWLASFASDTAYATYHIALAKNQMWTTMLTPILHNHLIKPAETLELTPSRRSLLRHRAV